MEKDKNKKDTKHKTHDASKYVELEPTMHEEESIDEVLSLAQRRQRGRVMKRYAARNARRRKITMRRKASNEKLKDRALKKARNIIKARLAGQKKYSELEPAQKIQVDKRLAKISKSKIQTIAKKQLPSVRSREMERIKKMRSTNEDLNHEFEQFLEARKYYTGLDDNTAEKRKAHFERGAKMNDDNPSAYTPAPGDEEAETKPSNYTKRYHRMFKKEGTVNCDRRFKIYREKKNDYFTEEFAESVVDLAESVDSLYENSKIIQKKADETGISYDILKQVFDRGVAAWRTGHRPGTTPAQWGVARINSFATGGKTQKTTDSDLWAKHKGKNESLSLDEKFELRLEGSAKETMEKALSAIHKYVTQGVPLADIAYEVSRAAGIDKTSRQLMRDYINKYGEPTRGKKVSADHAAKLRQKYGFAESKFATDREEGTDSLVSIYKKDTPGEQAESYNSPELDTNYGGFEKGSTVSFKNHSMDYDDDAPKTGTVVGSNTSFLKVRDEEGTLYKVRHSDVLSESVVALTEKVELPTDKGLGINRKDMPQIASTDVNDFLRFVKKNGVKVERKAIDPSLLKPTQNQFNKSKIQGMMDYMQSGSYSPKAIIISKDNRVMDGHHRWLAHKELKTDMPVIQIGLDAEQLFDMMHRYPKSFKKKLSEEVDVVLVQEDMCPLITKSQMKKFEKVVDDLFKRFKMDFNFTAHFRERMSDPRNKPCIDIKELASIITKIYKKQGKSIKDVAGAEAVVKDLQTDLNIPVAVKYDSRNDEFDVVMKTIMRKKDFKTPNKIIKY